jgi:hypothetical protein
MRVIYCGRWFLVGLVLAMLSCIAEPALCQSGKKSIPPEVALSKGVEMGAITISPIANEKRLVVFRLATSWIPGEGRKGFFRYRLSAVPYGADPDGVATYLRKLSSCSLYLEIYDSEQFKLRSIPVIFDREVSNSGDLVSMTSNDMVQMDLMEYKSFAPAGSWNVSWRAVGSCAI